MFLNCGTITNVHRWEDGGPAALRATATFEGHTDWVNDVALLKSETLVSASADRTVCLWRARSNGEASHWLHASCAISVEAGECRGHCALLKCASALAACRVTVSSECCDPL